MKQGAIPGISSSPRLTDAINTVLNSQQQIQRVALDQLEVEEKCQFHSKETNIAVDDVTGQYACNKCVFEKRITKPLFMATYARQTKRNFDVMYESLLRNITSIEDLTPSLISQRIQSQIQDFFAAIYIQLKEIERDVLQQVKQSTKLKELASLIETLQAQFDEELLQRLESERTILEDKVEKARYGYIVSRKQYYNDLIKEMEGFNVKIHRKIEDSGTLLTDLINVKVEKLKIYEKLYDLVETSVLINNVNIERKAPPPMPVQEINLFASSNYEEEKNENFHQQLNGTVSPFKTPKEKNQSNPEINGSAGSS